MKKLSDWFEKRSYEFIGGLTGLLAPYLLYILSIFFNFIPAFIAFPIEAGVWFLIWPDNYPQFSFFLMILDVALWFVLGYTAGWIIKKLKNTKKQVKFIILIFIILSAVFLYLKIINPFQSEAEAQYKKFSVATEELNEQKCEELKDQFMIYWCLEIIAREKKDLSICDKIGGEFEKDGCYWFVNEMNYVPAKVDKNLYEKWCPTFKSDYYKERCDYYFLNDAVSKNDLTLCERINSRELKEECYWHALSMNENKSLSYYKKHCSLFTMFYKHTCDEFLNSNKSN